MAEFTKVIRQAKRMCEAYGDECSPCKLHENYGLCPLVAQTDNHIPADWVLDKMPEVERIVMDWAAANPEPRYFMDEERAAEYCTGRCRRCHTNPIPADIAEKLGVKPVGGT